MYLAQSTSWEHSPDLIGIYKCWSLRRRENRSTRRKPGLSEQGREPQTN